MNKKLNKLKGGQEKMQLNKQKASIILALLLVCTIFATVFVLAQGVEDSGNQPSANASEDLGIQDQSALSQAVDDSNLTSPGFAKVGFTKVTYAQGWSISADTGYLVNALWATQSFVRVDRADVKSIRDQYKGDPQGALQALKNLAGNSTITTKSSGRLQLGIGKDHSNFKLVRTDSGSNNQTRTFDVYALGEGNSTGELLGSLSLTGTAYTNFTLWKGTLTLNSGDKAGTYDVSLASKSVTATGVGNAGAGKIVAQAEKQAANKLGFWQRLFNFGRNKANNQANKG